MTSGTFEAHSSGTLAFASFHLGILVLIGAAACSSAQSQTDATFGGSATKSASTNASSKSSGGSTSRSETAPGNSGGTAQSSAERNSSSTTIREDSGGTGGVPASKTSARGGESNRSSASSSSSTGGRSSMSAAGGVATSGGASSTGGSPSVGGGSSTTKSTDTNQAAESSGCGKDKPAQVPSSVDVSGTDRTFIVDVPPNYDPNTPTPILFAFHGMSLTAAQFRSFDKLNSAFASTYLIVRPNALGDPTQWQSTGTQDFLFFDAMFKLLTETYCIDTKRVFLTGHSSGGYFTNALACQRTNLIRGIAPQSGAGPIETRKCVGTALAAMIIHGQSDTSVLPAEGAKSRDYWGKAAGCDVASGTTSSLSSVCLEYSGCEAGHPLVYCPYDGDHNLWKDAPKTMFQFFNSL